MFRGRRARSRLRRIESFRECLNVEQLGARKNETMKNWRKRERRDGREK